MLSLTGWTPYAGRKVRGKPVRTIVRGRTVFVDGKVVGEKGWGRLASPPTRQAAGGLKS